MREREGDRRLLRKRTSNDRNDPFTAAAETESEEIEWNRLRNHRYCRGCCTTKNVSGNSSPSQLGVMFRPQIFCNFSAGNSSLAFSSKSFLLFCPFLTSCVLSHDFLSYSFIGSSYLTMPPQRGTISKGFTLVILRGKSPKRPLPPLSFMLVFTSSELVARQQQQTASCQI